MAKIFGGYDPESYATVAERIRLFYAAHPPWPDSYRFGGANRRGSRIQGKCLQDSRRRPPKHGSTMYHLNNAELEILEQPMAHSYCIVVMDGVTRISTTWSSR